MRRSALYAACERQQRDNDMSQPTQRMIKTNGINMKQWVPQLREVKMLPGCGHWTQQERPAEVNAALIGFLRSLG
jgi:pimeloyl-ACP methyl ester carboxylesterase